MIKAIYRKLKKYYQRFVRLESVFYAGTKYTCPVCEGHFNSFKTYRGNYFIKGVKVDHTTKNYTCPKCGSGIRHRLVMGFLKSNVQLVTGKKNVLHFAPEEFITDYFNKFNNINYIKANIDPSKYKNAIELDITNIKLNDNSVDGIICIHVLEHIEDDLKAISELSRILVSGGYPRFTKIGELFNPAKTYQLNTIALFSKLSKNILTGKYKKIAQVFASKKLEDTYTYMMGHISQDELMKLSMNSYFSYGSEIAKYPQGNMDTESYIYYLLAKRYLPETVLNKTDRATMAYSLEARVPFLDHRLVEYAGTIPFKMKTQNGTSKFLLRQLLNKYIPKSLTDRPKKGFDVPLDWRKKDLNDIAKHYFDFNKIKNEGFFDPKEVKKLLDDHVNGKMNNGIRLWILLNFELWLEKYG